MPLEKIEPVIDKFKFKPTLLPKDIKCKIIHLLDTQSQSEMASSYYNMFHSKGNIFQDRKLLTKLSEFIASGKMEKIEGLRELRPDLSSQIDKIVQIELFKLAGAGEQDKIEQLLKRYPELLLSYAPLKDISGVQLVIKGKKEGITIFQHAIWTRDVRYMCPMMLNCLPKTEIGEKIRRDLKRQQAELMDKGVEYELNGEKREETQFSLEPLIKGLQTYFYQFNNWTRKQQDSHWCTVVGHAQMLLPAYIRQIYCDPKQSFEEPNFRRTEFTRCLEFRNLLDRKMESWGSSLSGVGVRFGILRAQSQPGAVGLLQVGKGGLGMDLEAIIAFDKVTTEDTKLLEEELEKSIENSKENQGTILGNY